MAAFGRDNLPPHLWYLTREFEGATLYVREFEYAGKTIRNPRISAVDANYWLLRQGNIALRGDRDRKRGVRLRLGGKKGETGAVGSEWVVLPYHDRVADLYEAARVDLERPETNESEAATKYFAAKVDALAALPAAGADFYTAFVVLFGEETITRIDEDPDPAGDIEEALDPGEPVADDLDQVADPLQWLDDISSQEEER